MDITFINGNYSWKFDDDAMAETLWKIYLVNLHPVLGLAKVSKVRQLKSIPQAVFFIKGWNHTKRRFAIFGTVSDVACKYDHLECYDHTFDHQTPWTQEQTGQTETDGQTDKTVGRDAWSQLKKSLEI